jgi:hypothetical protein
MHQGVQLHLDFAVSFVLPLSCSFAFTRVSCLSSVRELQHYSVGRGRRVSAASCGGYHGRFVCSHSEALQITTNFSLGSRGPLGRSPGTVLWLRLGPEPRDGLQGRGLACLRR